jgi:predicted metal-dependent peptidase
MTDQDKLETIPKRNPNRKPEEYQFSHILMALSMKEPFLGAVAEKILKFEDWTVPTAYVSYSEKTNRFVMGYNPEFFARSTEEQIMWVLKHELYHVILGHITTRYIDKTKYKKILNIAQDLAINSIIDGPNRHPLAIVPGEYPENCKDPIVGMMIGKLPKLQSMEYYFERLKSFSEFYSKNNCPICNKNKKTESSNEQKNSQNSDNKSDNGESVENNDSKNKLCAEHGGDDFNIDIGNEIGETVDIHNYKEIPEGEEEIANEQLKEILVKAAKNAEEKKNWGSVPINIKEKILDIIKPEINWKSVLKYFIGSRISSKKESTIKRINKKFPYIFPGIKNTRLANFVFFIDNSGSMSKEDVELALGAALECSNEIKIHVYNFDTTIDTENVQVWSRGSQKEWKRTKYGGTSFKCIYDFLTRPENKGKWTGAAVVTDGYADKIPFIPGIKIIWLITPRGTIQYIEKNSLVIQMTKDKTVKKL